MKNRYSIESFKYKTYDQCFEAVKEDGRMLEFVPLKFRDYEMCLAATYLFTDKDPIGAGMSLQFVPSNVRTPDYCLMVAKKHVKQECVRELLENLFPKMGTKNSPTQIIEKLNLIVKLDKNQILIKNTIKDISN